MLRVVDGVEKCSCCPTSANSLHLAQIDDVACAEIDSDDDGRNFYFSTEESLPLFLVRRRRDSVFRRNLTASGVLSETKNLLPLFHIQIPSSHIKTNHYIIFTSTSFRIILILNSRRRQEGNFGENWIRNAISIERIAFIETK